MARQTDMGFEAPHPIAGEHSQDILVCGNSFTADPSGALYWEAQKTLVVSNLRLGKGPAKPAKDRFLPPYDSRSALRRLAAVMDRYDPDRVIALGDSFHDQATARAIPRSDRNKLSILRQGREWYWVTEIFGPDKPDWLGGVVCPALTLDGMKFRHGPSMDTASREIAGGLHPAARLTREGRNVRRKCFITDGARMVVPAFGVYEGGQNVLEKPFADLFKSGDFHVWILGRKQVYAVAKNLLLGDAG